jgi:ariadne-1
VIIIDFDDMDDGQDGMIDFDSQDKDYAKPKKLPYEVDFKVLTPEQIEKAQNLQIAEVRDYIDQPDEGTAILLRHFHWNKERLIETYMDKSEEILDSCGMDADGKAIAPQTKVVPGFACDICCEDEEGLETFAMKCEHRYCRDCYQQYITQKIKDEGEAARIQCPKDGCARIVDTKSVDFLVSPDTHDR